MEESSGSKVSFSKKASIISLAFIVEFTCWGLFYSYSMFFTSLVEDLNSSYAFMGFIGTFVLAVAYFMGTIPAMLVEATSYGVVIALAGVFLFLSFFITSYDMNDWEALFSYALLLGIANGFTVVVFNYFVDHIENDFNMAISVTTTAAGFGMMFFSCVAAYLLINDIMHWREIFRVFSSAGAVVIVTALGFQYYEPTKVPRVVDDEATAGERRAILTEEQRAAGGVVSETPAAAGDSEENPLTHRKHKDHKHEVPHPAHLEPETPLSRNDSDSSDPSAKAQAHGWELVFSPTDHRALYLFISHFFAFATSFFPFKISIFYIETVSSDQNCLYYMPITLGVGMILSRSITGILQMYFPEKINGFFLMKVNQLGCVLVLLVLANMPVESVSAALALSMFGLYALFQAGTIPLVPVRTMEVLGTTNHLMNVGVQFFALGLGVASGGYTAGYIYDVTASFRWCFAYIALYVPVALLVDELCFPEYSFLCNYGGKIASVAARAAEVVLQ
eukprot:gene2202-1607_t